MGKKQTRDVNNIVLFNGIFLIGLIVKYDFLLLAIYQAPSVSGLLLRNILFLTLAVVFIYPYTRKKAVRNTMVIATILFTAFFLMNIWYNRYFGNYLSISDIMMGRGMRPMKVLFLQLLHPLDAFAIIDILLLFYTGRKAGITHQDEFSRLPYRVGLFGRIVAVCIMIVLLALQLVWTNSQVGNYKPLPLYHRSTSAFVSVYGIIPLYGVEYFLLQQGTGFTLDQEEPSTPEIENDLIGERLVKKDENIIFIQVESLDKHIIGHRHNGREVTPFLNQLRDEALYFDNFYAQHINGSFDAEFSFFTSFYPINKNYGFKVNDLSAFTSIVGILNDRDYNTLAFHGNDKTFFSRDKAYDELGFDNFYSREDYDENRMLYSSEKSYLGINDYDFFRQSFEFIEEDAEQPFFAFLITVTSHTPFDFYPAEFEIEEFKDVQNPLVRGYFNSAAFVDASLEYFYTKLSENGLLEDTLVVIYSDHDAGIDKVEYSSGADFVLKKQVKTPENIPLFILHPDIEPKTSHKEGTPTDLAPTVLDLLGEKEKPQDFLGYSLLSDVEVPILFMHEIPQFLYNGQLYALYAEGLEHVGYREEEGKWFSLPQSEEDLIDLTEYLKTVQYERRNELPEGEQ
ncbi:MAG: LTA synthase family protein [Spirochaetota bacterium]